MPAAAVNRFRETRSRSRLRVRDEPLPEEALAARVAGLRVARVVVQRGALVGDLLRSVVAADHVEGSGHAAAGLQLILRLDGERRPRADAIGTARALA